MRFRGARSGCGLIRLGLEHVGKRVEHALVAVDPFQRAFACDRLDATHTRCDATFGRYLEDANIASTANMRTATQFDREIAKVQHTNSVAVLFAK